MAQPDGNEDKGAPRRKQPGTGFFGPHSRQALLTGPKNIPDAASRRDSTPMQRQQQLHNPRAQSDVQPEEPCRGASFSHGSDVAAARLELLLGSSAPAAAAAPGGFLHERLPAATAAPRAAMAGRSSSYTTGNSSGGQDGPHHGGLHRWWSTGAGIHQQQQQQQQQQQHLVLPGSSHPCPAAAPRAAFDPTGGVFASDLLQQQHGDTSALQHQSGVRGASGGGGSITRRGSLGASGGPVAGSCHMSPGFGAPASPPSTTSLSYYSSSLGSNSTLRAAYSGHQGTQARISCCSSSSHSSAPLPSSPLAYGFASPASSSTPLPSVALGSSPGSNWPHGCLPGFGAGPAGNNGQPVQQQPLLMVLEDIDGDAPPLAADVQELSQLLQLQQLVLGTRHAVASAQSAVHAAASPCGHGIDTAAPGTGRGVGEAGIAAAGAFSAPTGAHAALAGQLPVGSSSRQLPSLVPLVPLAQPQQQAPSLFAPHLAANINAPAPPAADALQQQQLLQLLLQQQEQEQHQHQPQQQTEPSHTSRAVMAKLQQLIEIQDMQMKLQEELIAILPVLAND